jgi:hypothetical protein
MTKCTVLSDGLTSLDMANVRSSVPTVNAMAGIMGVLANSIGLPPGVLECTVTRIESEAVLRRASTMFFVSWKYAQSHQSHDTGCETRAQVSERAAKLTSCDRLKDIPPVTRISSKS